MTRSASQTGVSILGGFRAIESERKVRFGQTWWQSKGLMEYYHIKLFKRQSRPFIKPQNPKSSKISDITFKLLLLLCEHKMVDIKRHSAFNNIGGPDSVKTV